MDVAEEDGTGKRFLEKEADACVRCMCQMMFSPNSLHLISVALPPWRGFVHLTAFAADSYILMATVWANSR